MGVVIDSRSGKKIVAFVTGIFLLSGAMTADSKSNAANECVVLLHGLGRTAWSMGSVAEYLRTVGYRVVNQGYESTSSTIEQVARHVVPRAVASCGPSADKIHFVTHSLGGIVVRYYLQKNALPAGSRIVMLSPPNQGSEIADRYRQAGWYQWLTGPAGQQLTTAGDSVPNQLRPIPYDVGVITGRKTMDPWFSAFIPGEDDGKVAVERARLDGMKDFLVVNHSHPFIMRSRAVHEQILSFLRSASFHRRITE